LFEAVESRLLLCYQHEIGGVAVTTDTGGPFVPLGPVASSPIAPKTGPTLEVAPTSAAAAPTSWSTTASGLPILNSKSGAPVSIFLDFDGWSGSGFGGQQTFVAFSTDADGSTFNAGEQSDIVTGWDRLSTFFAPFDINVTTIQPGTGDKFSWSVISNTVSGGYSYLNFYGGSGSYVPSAFNASGDLVGRTSGLIHEIGHNFGMAHQATYDNLGNMTAEYTSAADPLHGPIMGVDFDGSVKTWLLGHPSGDRPTVIQDDISLIVNKVKQYSPGGATGYRADDYAGAANGTATSLTFSGERAQATGIIEQLTDADAFSFTSTGGAYTIAADRDGYSGADLKLEVYDATGTLVSQSDTAANNQSVNVALPAGTYYAVVRSHGNYSDIGRYALSVQAMPAGWGGQDVGAVGVGGTTAYDPASGTWTIEGGGADVWDNADEFRFTYQSLDGDGQIVARVASQENTDGWAKSGVMIRETLAADSKHAFMTITPGNGASLQWRASTGGASNSNTSGGFAAPYWVKLVRSGNTITGFRSSDGVNWAPQGGAVTIAMNRQVYVGLAVTAHNDSTLSTGTFTGVAITGNVNPAPADGSLPAATLTASTGLPGQIALSWADVAGADGGYAVLRSINGSPFAPLATLAAGATGYTDAGLGGNQRYFYKLVALKADGTGGSVSNTAQALTRPPAVFNARVSSISATQLTIDWRGGDSSGESGYVIERSTDNVNWTQVGTPGQNAISFNDSGLSPGTTYSYRITPSSGLGAGASVTVSGSTRLPQVSGLVITSVTSTTVWLSWGAVAGAGGYRIERSVDGTTWTTLRSVAAGVTQANDATVTALNEYHYRLVATNAAGNNSVPSAQVFTATPDTAPLPSPWASQDIGGVGGAGAAGYNPTAGTWTVLGAGIDVWGNADEFRFTYQTLDGDGSIVARVASQENTDGWAKSGVMIRETLAANSKHAFMLVSPGNGTALQYRTSTGGASSNNNTGGVAAPYWVKLVRSGNTIFAYRSADGVTWNAQGSPLTIAMNRQVYIGLAVLGSGGDDDLNTTTFTDVSVATPNAAPTVAVAAAASPSPVTGTTTDLTVLGADDAGEPNLTYTWAASAVPPGAAAPTFSVNGVNTAKNATATFTHPGNYAFTVTITDAGGRSVSSTVAVTVATTVTAAHYDGGRALALTFNVDVSANLFPAELAVQAVPGGATVRPTSVAWDADTRTATYTFAAPFADGNYHATHAADARFGYDFFALAGDATGDRVVNFDDLLALAKNYNKTAATWSQGDFTGDGLVNFDDLLVLAKNYNKTVPADGAAPAPPAPMDVQALAAAMGIAAPTPTTAQPTAPPAPTRKPVASAKPAHKPAPVPPPVKTAPVVRYGEKAKPVFSNTPVVKPARLAKPKSH
jgi:hypothetical protein